MDLIQLGYFQAIARNGSFTRAARQLGVSQPTLSVAMQHLERKLATRLFHRDRQGARLTDAGRELMTQTARIFAVIEATEQRIHGLQNADVGRFTIGCHGSLGAYFLPGFMSGFMQDAPGIELSLWNGRSSAVWESVLERDIHFGLIVNPRPHPELVLTRLFRDAIDVVAAPPAGEAKNEAPLRPARKAPRKPPARTRDSSGGKEGAKDAAEAATEPVLDPEKVAAHARLLAGPLIYADNYAQNEALIGRLAGEGLLPNRVLICGDLEQVKSLAIAGIGVALLPRRVAEYGQPGHLRRLHPSLPSHSDQIYLVYRGDLHRTKAALHLKDALVAHGRELDGQFEE